MTATRPRPLRSTTLLSGSSSFSQRPVTKMSLRMSPAGHWTLIDPSSHRALYHVQGREIRRNSFDGPLLATFSAEPSSATCQLSFLDGNKELEIKSPRKLSWRGRHRFVVNGRKLYWKHDIVCRESLTRRVYADTDENTLLIYENADPFKDVIAVTFLAMKLKHPCKEPSGCSLFNVSNLYFQTQKNRCSD